jgi:short-subunit dehydrogenase
MSRRDGEGRTALVTGASAGIGAELARVFAANGFDLVLTARRAERLNELAGEMRRLHGVRVRTLPADLALPETPRVLIAALEGEGVTVDALINNAGFAVPARYRDTSWDVQRDFLQVLVTAPCELIQRLLPGMTARGYGRILNVASVAGLMPGAASHTLYGGAKAMLIKISQSLSSEQKGTGVHVTALCPGFTYTEFHDVSGTREAMRHMPKMMWLKADRVAREGYDAVMKNRATCVPGVQYKTITALARLLPLRAGHHVAELRSRILAKRR